MNLPTLSRRHALKLIAAGMTGGSTCLADAVLIEPGWLSVTREEIACDNLPPALDGLRIALLADFHFRPESDHPLLDSVLRAVAVEKPDIIALCGDFMNRDPRVVEPLAKRLGEMQAAHGVFAVMGNHDGWAGDPSVIRRHFEKSGIAFLINQNSILPIRGESLAVAGTDFVWRGKPDPARALKGIPLAMPVLAMVHEPDYFDTMTAHRDITLQLSGHTHGGQCRVPVVGYLPRKVSYGRKYSYGSYASGGSKLFVTRGVGTTGLRVRFACRPELAVLTLRAAA